MLDRLRAWLSSDAAPEDKDSTWGVPLFWGALVVVAFTTAITVCNDPADVTASPGAGTSVAPTTTVATAPPGATNLVELIGDQPQLTFFRSLITTAGIEDPLSTQGDFTFFAPTDEAFAALTDEERRAMLDPVVADRVLQTHVAFGRLLAADMVSAGEVATIIGLVRPVAVAGSTVLIDEASVVSADLAASNGIVHIVDSVLVLDIPPAPDQPVLQLLDGRDDLATFRTALGAVETDLLPADTAGFTVFAPNDAAFAALPAGSVDLLVTTQPKLLELLGYHVVPGAYLAADLADGDVLTTSSGAELAVSVADGVLTVGSAAIVEPDLVGADGVVHIVGDVLLPPDYELPTINEALSLEPVTFETNSSVITPEGIGVLSEAVAFLTANPTVRVGIEGHTDSQGGADANQALSEARANSVRDYLIGEGIAADRLEAQGFGETRPIAPNDTAEGRAQNRRIEFRLI